MLSVRGSAVMKMNFVGEGYAGKIEHWGRGQEVKGEGRVWLVGKGSLFSIFDFDF